MYILKDLYETNKEVFIQTTKKIIKNWQILFVGIVYILITLVGMRIAMLAGILAGILMTLLQSAICSNYLYLIENIIGYNRISLDDFKEGFKVYIWKIYGVLVIGWFIQYGIDLFLSPVFNLLRSWFDLKIILLLGIVLFNALPEVIYQKQYDIGETLKYTIDFIKQNPIDWIVPNIILGGVFYWALKEQYFFINYLVASIIMAWIMVYRGMLFGILSKSTRKKRIFIRNIHR